MIFSRDPDRSKGWTGPLVLFMVAVAFLGGSVTTFLIQRQLQRPGAPARLDAEAGKPVKEAPILSAEAPLSSPKPGAPSSAAAPAPITGLAADHTGIRFDETAGATPQAPEAAEGLQSLAPGASRWLTALKQVFGFGFGGGAVPAATAANAALPEPAPPLEAAPAIVPETSSPPSPPGDLLPSQVVANKGEGLTKIVARHYPPGQYRTVLDAIILANPEISSENVILPGQAITLPRINFLEQTVQLQDGLQYALYGSYYEAESWKGDKPWLEKNQVQFVVRVTRESSGRMIHRVFLGGYEELADLREAQRRLRIKSRRRARPLREKLSENTAVPTDEEPKGLEEQPHRPDEVAVRENQEGQVSASVTGRFQPQDTQTEAPIFSAPWLRSMAFQWSAAGLDSPKALASLPWKAPAMEGRAVAAGSISLAGIDPSSGAGFAAAPYENNKKNEKYEKDQIDQIAAGEGAKAPLTPGVEIQLPEANAPVAAPAVISALTLLKSGIACSLKQYWESRASVLSDFWQGLKSLTHSILPARPLLNRAAATPRKKGPLGAKGEAVLASAPETGPAREAPAAAFLGPMFTDQTLLPSIRRYLDSKGIWRINNEASPPGNLRSATTLAEAWPENPAGSLDRLNEVQPAPENSKGRGPLRGVSWPVDDPYPQSPDYPGPAEKALLPGEPGAIRRYRDGQGVLHIVNSEPKNPQSETILTEEAGGDLNGAPERPLEPQAPPLEPPRGFPLSNLPVPGENSDPADFLPARVVANKGEGLNKIMARHYPRGQEGTVLNALILANPEISSDNVIYPGQVIDLPKIDFQAQTVQLRDGKLYALYGSYYAAASWKGDEPWLEKSQVHYLVRITRESSGRMIHRVFLGGYENLADLEEAHQRLRTKGTQALLLHPEKSGGQFAVIPAKDQVGVEEPGPGSKEAAFRRNGAEQVPSRVTMDTRPQGSHYQRSISAPPWLKSLLFRKAAAGFEPFPETPAPLALKDPSWGSPGEAIHPSVEEGRAPRTTQPEVQVREAMALPVATPAIPAFNLFKSGLARSLGQSWNTPASLLTEFWQRLTALLPSRALLSRTAEPPGKAAPAAAEGEAAVLASAPETPLAAPQETGPDGDNPPAAFPELILTDKALLPKIRRYLDGQGVWRIDNAEPHPPGLQNSEDLTVAGPENSAGSRGRPGEVQAPAPENAKAAWPVSKASWPIDAQPLPAPVRPLPREIALPPAESGAVRHYRDGQGVLHIVNAEPLDPKTGTILAEEAGGGPKGFSEKPLEAKRSPVEKASAPAPLRKVSWPGEDQDPLGPTPAKPREMALPPAREGSILGYRDAQGVLHIVNAEPKNPTPLNPASQTVAGQGSGQTSNPPPPAPAPAEGQGPMRTASWPDGDRAPLSPSPAKPREPALLAEGSIRRYRDAKGILHIESVEAPLPPSLPLHLPLAREIPGNIPGRAGAGSESPTLEGGPRLPQTPSGPQIVAFRDKQGRLSIRNLAPRALADKANQALARAELDPVIVEAALSYSLPVPLIIAVIKVESNFVPWAVSPKGAMGLMQLMPGTAEFLGVQDPFSPRENIMAGCRYLRLLLDCFHDDLTLALAAYDAGYQRVINAGYQVPEIKETQDYVRVVLSQYYNMVLASRPSGT